MKKFRHYLQCTSPEIPAAQQEDQITNHLQQALSSPTKPPTMTQRCCPPLQRYRQIRPQVASVDGVVCRHYTPGSTSERERHFRCSQPASTSKRYKVPMMHLLLDTKETYRVGTSADVDHHCRECIICQRSKLPAPTRALMSNKPIGHPWQMITVDILEMPLSYQNNH